MDHFRTIELDYYESRIKDIMECLQASLIRLFCDVIRQMPGSDQKKAILHLLEKPQKSFSILNRDCLIHEADSQFLAYAGTKVNLNHKNSLMYADQSVIQDLYERRISGMGQAELVRYNCGCIGNFFDVAAALKAFMFAYRCPPLYAAVKNRYGIDLTANSAEQSIFYTCLDARNEVMGHKNKVNREKLSQDRFISVLTSSKEVLDLFSGNAADPETAGIISRINSLIASTDLPPVTFAEIRARIPEFTEKYLVRSDMKKEVDFENEIIYFHTADEIALYVQPLLEDYTAAMRQYAAKNKELAEVQANVGAMQETLARIGEFARIALQGNPAVRAYLPAGMISDPGPESPAERTAVPVPLTAFAGYKKGLLSEAQVDELIDNCLFVTDPTVWLDEKYANYIARTLLGRMRKKGKKPVIFGVSRVELFKKESLGDEAAHHARNVLSFLHSRGQIVYGPLKESYTTTEIEIIEAARNNPAARIVILTMNNDLIEELAAADIPNVLPVSVFSDKALWILSKAADKVPVFAGLAADKQEPEPVPAETPAPEQSAADAMPFAEPEAAVSLEPTPAMVKTGPAGNRPPVFGMLGEITSLPESGAAVKNGRGDTIVLGKLLGRGGEGSVYEIAGQENRVAKIYHIENITPDRYEKLKLMVRSDPKIRELMWPLSLVYDQNDCFIGYIMPKVDLSKYKELGLSLFAMNKERIANGLMKDWDRAAMVDACRLTAGIFRRMHGKNILMGDVNPRNILLDPDRSEGIRIRIVDCDSFQIGSYPCPVGLPYYTSPEIYRRTGSDNPEYSTFLRTAEDEQYALASLFFRMLTFNSSPFMGKGVKDPEQARKEYNFMYRREDDSGANTIDGPYRMIWNNMSFRVKNNFIKVFTGQGTVSAKEWENAFRQYQGEIAEGRSSAEIFPTRYAGDTVDFTCSECGKTGNMLRKKYDEVMARKGKLYCSSCNALIMRLRNDPEKADVRCVKCGRMRKTDKWTATQASRGEREFICESCRQKEAVTCTNCGKTETMPHYIAARMDNYICKDCRKDVTVPCDICGDPVKIQKYRLDRILRNNKRVRCDSCRTGRY